MKNANKYSDYINYREALANTYIKLTEQKKLKIAYFGGSITCGGGSSGECWRTLFHKHMEEKYPNAEIEMINAAVGGTGSSYALYRLKEDVLEKAPDLVIIEYAVNDNYPGINDTATVEEYYESIIRNIYAHDPMTDIICVYTAHRFMDRNAFTSQAHDAVAAHYNINSVFFGQALLDFMAPDYKTNDEEWSKYYSDTYHPNENGYRVLVRPLIEFIDNALELPAGTKPAPKTILPDTLAMRVHPDPILYRANKLEHTAGWSVEGGNLVSDEVGAECSLRFVGNELTLYSRLSPECGMIDVSIDGGDFKRYDLYSFGLSERTVLADGLGGGEHNVVIRVAEDKNPKAEGRWIKLTALMVN